jgi:hypothetical protein
MNGFARLSDQELDVALENGFREMSVSSLQEVKNTTSEFRIVAVHERGCGCTSVYRNPKCELKAR